MSDIYWITVLGKIANLAIVIFVISIFNVIMCFAVSDTPDPAQNARFAKAIKTFGIIGCISLLIIVVIPSKKDLYFIYGAGTIIDYCQDNPKVKEIPDKAVDALNTWLDMVNEEKEK